MAILKGVLNNFGRHVVSGLSSFVFDAYESCEKHKVNNVELYLLETPSIQDDFQDEEKLIQSASQLKEKFKSIIASDSKLSIDDIEALTISIDFFPDEALVQNRKEASASVPVWYGYNAVFDCHIRLVSKEGQVKEITLQDSGR